MKAHDRKTVFTALLLFTSLVTFVLYAEINSTASGQPLNEIRMEVDPTVLPPVTPPEPEASEATPEAKAPEQPEVELPDIETRTPLPAPPGKETAKESPKEADLAPDTAEVTPPKASPAKDKPMVQSNTEVEVTPAPEALTEQVVTPAPVGVGKGAVTKVTMESTDKQLVLTVFCNRPVGDTTYMNLSNPKRLVVDLREPWTLKARNVIRVKSGAVKHVVMGSHPDRLRLVVHFRTPPKGRLAPTFQRIGNKLIVTADLP